MTRTRFGALLALMLSLVLAACSTPDDPASNPNLAPQFGTRGYDEVTDVAYGKALNLYAVGTWNSLKQYEDDYSEPQDAFVRRYDRSGNLIWENYLDIEPAYDSGYYVSSLMARAVTVDGSGNAIVAWSGQYGQRIYTESGDYYYQVAATFNYLTKYSLSGSKVWRVYTNNALTDLATDSSGNIYAISGSALVKYTSGGTQSWSRSQSSPEGVAVSSTNNIYIVRADGTVVKFNGSGTQLYSKVGQLNGYDGYGYKIAAGASDEVYVATKYFVGYGNFCQDHYSSEYANRVYKLSNTGAKQWSKDVAIYTLDCETSDYDLPNKLGVATDTSGNVYVASYDGNSENKNGFVAKYSRTGTLSWKKGFGTPRDDIATSVATHDGSEVYIGATTAGFLVHRQIGGGGDAVLREVNSSGTLSWAR